MATTVSGEVGAFRDEVFDGIVATLTRQGGVVGFNGGAIAPDVETYVTSGGGVLTMPDLKPGKYTLSLAVPANPETTQTVLWEATGSVPSDAGATITLEAFLDKNVDQVTPSILRQALAAAAAAQEASASAFASAASAGASAANAGISETNAAISAADALSAALAAGASLYPSVADGLADTVNGDYFFALTRGGEFSIYLNNAGESQFLATLNRQEASGISVRTTLNMQFANAQVIDPRFTFARSSVATVTDRFGVLQTVAANAPRFDHGDLPEGPPILRPDTVGGVPVLVGPKGDNGTDGADGLGWTGGSYDPATGVVTFTSDDGLGFATGDLRGADGTGTGTVTSVDITGGAGIDATGGPVTVSGAITVGLDAATVASLGNADTAFGWGDHAEAGYITSVAWGDVTDKPTFATVATTGAYSDLTGLPTLGTAAGTNADAYATAAQGATADAALPRAGGTMTGTLAVLGVTETDYTLTGTEISVANGTIQTKTLSGATTLTAALSNGQGVLLRLIGGDTHAVTWPTMTWMGGSEPTLTADDWVSIWQSGGTVYGASVGSAA